MTESTSESSDLPQLKSNHLKNEAYKVIKEGITSLRFKPGDPVNEGDLARLLGISKTPVRNALIRLEQEGLVHTAPFRGTYVTSVTPKDVAEIYEVRGALEELAIRQVIGRLPPEEIKGLFDVIEEGRASAEHGLFTESVEAIRRFHEGLVNASGNRWLTSMYDSLSSHLARIRNICGHIPGRVEKSHTEHSAIIQAVDRGDSEGATKALRQHLLSLAEDYYSAAEEALQALEDEAEAVPAE